MCYPLFSKRDPIIIIIKPCGCKIHHSKREAFVSSVFIDTLTNSINGVSVLVRCKDHKEIYDTEIETILNNRIMRRKIKYEKNKL